MLLGQRTRVGSIPCAQCKMYQLMEANGRWFTDGDITKGRDHGRAQTLLDNSLIGDGVLRPVFQVYKALAGHADQAQTKGGRIKALIKKLLKAGYRHLISAYERRRPKSGVPLVDNVYPLDIPLPPDEKTGWKPYDLFNGHTPKLRHLTGHVSVLTTDHCPHPPHTHNEEEILVPLWGEIDLLLAGEKDSEAIRRIRLKPGQGVYYPAHYPHSLQTVSAVPANYLMLKWVNAPRQAGEGIPFRSFNLFDEKKDSAESEGFCPRLVFEGATAYLKKLHCHTSTLSPGPATMSIPMIMMSSLLSCRVRSIPWGNAPVPTASFSIRRESRMAWLIRGKLRPDTLFLNSTLGR